MTGRKELKKWLILAAVLRGAVAGVTAVGVALLVLFGVLDRTQGAELVVRLVRVVLALSGSL